jgi:hypothetical protein
MEQQEGEPALVSAERSTANSDGSRSRNEPLVRRREAILKVIPDAEQGSSYGMGAFRFRGKVAAGFAACKNNLTPAPYRGSVLDQLRAELEKYSR